MLPSYLQLPGTLEVSIHHGQFLRSDFVSKKCYLAHNRAAQYYLEFIVLCQCVSWWFAVAASLRCFPNISLLIHKAPVNLSSTPRSKLHLQFCLEAWGIGHRAPQWPWKGILVREVSRRSQDVVGRGGKAKQHLPALMINTEDGSSLAKATQMGDISPHDKCTEWLNQKKATNTFISSIAHTDVSHQSRTREEISIRHERERKEANICGLEMEIKSLLLYVFILVPPSPLPSPASFWLLAFYSPISGWEYMLDEWFGFLQSHSTENEIFPAWVRLPCFVLYKWTAVCTPEQCRHIVFVPVSVNVMLFVKLWVKSRTGPRSENTVHNQVQGNKNLGSQTLF